MALVTSADLQARLGNYFTSIYNNDESLINAHISAASAEVESFIGLRYKMPPVTVKTKNLAKQYCLTLCEELAWGYQEPSKLPESIKIRVDAVRKLLGDIASGKIPFADGELNDDIENSILQSESPLFTRRTLEGY